jgi:hypothetical protein
VDATVFTIAMVVLAWVSGRLLMRRFPTVSRAQVFCALVALVGGVSIAGRPGGSQFWHYTGLVIAVVMSGFLLFALLRHWKTPRTSGPA